MSAEPNHDRFYFVAAMLAMAVLMLWSVSLAMTPAKPKTSEQTKHRIEVLETQVRELRNSHP